jgi:hypothetical protein
VEGSSSNKYIEIYNGTGATVNLSDYQVRLFSNGVSTASSSQNLNSLSGGPTTLANGASIVLKNASAGLTLPSGVVAYSSPVVNYNGDDALAIYKVSTSSYVDILGVIGDDPGTAWTNSSPSLTTLDKTLRRKSTVTSGVTVNPTGTGPSAFTTLASEWDQFNIDTVAGLGTHSPIRTYLAGFQNVDAGMATNLAVTGATPATEYFYVVRAVAGSATSGDSDSRAVTTTSLPPTGYDDWKSVVNNQPPDQDFDGDGLDNGTEYFMGTAGNAFTVNPGVVAGAVTWPRATGTTINTWRVEVSTDLVTWENATVNYGANLNTSNPAQVVFTMPTTPGKFFVRLMVIP